MITIALLMLGVAVLLTGPNVYYNERAARSLVEVQSKGCGASRRLR